MLFINRGKKLGYRPKDIVSGDFYWHTQAKNYIFIAVADCTGHGVPGAFMSMIGSRLLDEIIIEHNIHSPKDILSELNKEIIKIFTKGESSVADGMDILLCRVEKKENTEIVFTGAKLDLIYYSKEENTLKILKGDRKIIGGAFVSMKEKYFTNTKTTLKEGDIVYLATDGFMDQNNKERQRFGSQKLNEIIIANASKPLSKQKAILENELDEWQKDVIQRDDITVLAFRI